MMFKFITNTKKELSDLSLKFSVSTYVNLDEPKGIVSKWIETKHEKIVDNVRKLNTNII